MRFLGIDYGSKRVGLALSDENGRFAFPYLVLPADAQLIPKIKAICEKEKVGRIILGESKNYEQQPNPIMVKIEKFKKELATALVLPVEYEPEFLTSVEAERIVGKDELLDARAAALILKSYLDRHYVA